MNCARVFTGAAIIAIAFSTVGHAQAQATSSPDAQSKPGSADAPQSPAAPDKSAASDSAMPDVAASIGAGQTVTGNGQAGGDIIVTGSRLRSGYNSPTPTTVVTSNQLQDAAPNLTDSLNQLPVFKNSSRPQNASTSSVRDNGASFLNLRGLGAQRTLTLLDGRRVVASSSTGAPDTNLFPQDLIQRVDVVTGGASAAYGSDAVAGVVNFILDRHFTGLRVRGQSGVSTYGDGASRQGSLTFGTDFAGGRGHLIASAEYYEQDQIKPPGGRDWASNSCQIIGNPTPPPLRLIACNVNMTNATYGGVITAGPLANTMFLPGGVSAPFQRGTSVSGTTMIGGDGARIDQSLSAGLERWSTFARAEYKLTDAVTVYAEGAIATSNATFDQRPPQNLAGNNFTIFNDNAFLPADIKARMATAGVTSISVGRLDRDWGWINAKSVSNTSRITVGLDWDISSSWQLQLYGMRGINIYKVDTKNNQQWTRTYAAADAVRDPATGNIVCRSTLSGLNPGCVPLNIFGEGSASPAALSYILGDARSRLKLEEDVGSAVLRGDLFKLPGGNLSVAGGIEYRKEKATQTSDPTSQIVLNGAGVNGFPTGLVGSLGGFELANPQPLSGSYNVREEFLEVDAPILKDLPFASLLSFNGGVRFIDYSTVGSVTTWKIGGTYEPIKDLRFRATRSRDIRAANISELFSPPVNTGGFVFVNNVSTRWTGKRSGNPALQPEIADTVTAGAVLRPHWISGLGLSVDYYDIKIKGAISQLTAQQTIDGCAQGSAIACSVIGADPAGGLIIDSPTLNLSQVKMRGVDGELTYSKAIGSSRLSTRLLLSYLNKFSTTTPGAPAIDRAGDIGISGTPKWSGSFQVDLQNAGWDLFVQERYVGAGLVDSTAGPTMFTDNTVPAVFYTDVTIKANVSAFGKKSEIFLTVNNLLDKDPPIVPTSPYGTYRATNFSLYDVFGRYMTVGFKVNF